MDKIIDYLKEKYNPSAIVAYGSFVDGSNNSESDFDAFIVMDNPKSNHDSAIVDGIQLDVFIYGNDKFEGEIYPEDFVVLYDCNIILDKLGVAKKLALNVQEYIDSYKSSFDKDTFGVQWCRKMLRRAKRGDSEGLFRWHWVLTDSLEIYCNLTDRFYFGPKKTLILLEKNEDDAFSVYEKALKCFDITSLENWLNLLFRLYDEKYVK